MKDAIPTCHHLVPSPVLPSWRRCRLFIHCYTSAAIWTTRLHYIYIPLFPMYSALECHLLLRRTKSCQLITASCSTHSLPGCSQSSLKTIKTSLTQSCCVSLLSGSSIVTNPYSTIWQSWTPLEHRTGGLKLMEPCLGMRVDN